MPNITLATVNTIEVEILKKSILPVLGLCKKEAAGTPAYRGALCIESDGEDLNFFTTDGRTAFISKIKADKLGEPFKMIIKPEEFGLLRDHIKKAKKTLELTLEHDNTSGVSSLFVKTENGTITVRSIPKQEVRVPAVKNAMGVDAGTSHTAGPGQAHYNPKYLFSIINAGKDLQSVELVHCVYKDGMGQDYAKMFIRSSWEDPGLRFEALVMGRNSCNPNP